MAKKGYLVEPQAGGNFAIENRPNVPCIDVGRFAFNKRRCFGDLAVYRDRVAELNQGVAEVYEIDQLFLSYIGSSVMADMIGVDDELSMKGPKRAADTLRSAKKRVQGELCNLQQCESNERMARLGIISQDIEYVVGEEVEESEEGEEDEEGEKGEVHGYFLGDVPPFEQWGEATIELSARFVESEDKMRVGVVAYRDDAMDRDYCALKNILAATGLPVHKLPSLADWRPVIPLLRVHEPISSQAQFNKLKLPMPPEKVTFQELKATEVAF